MKLEHETRAKNLAGGHVYNYGCFRFHHRIRHRIKISSFSIGFVISHNGRLIDL